MAPFPTVYSHLSLTNQTFIQNLKFSHGQDGRGQKTTFSMADSWVTVSRDLIQYYGSVIVNISITPIFSQNMLSFYWAKIELFKDITMFDYVDSSILEGLCIASENISDNDDNKSTISCCDVCSLYPYIMTQKLPISNYKFVTKFNKLKYGQNKNHSCLLNVEIYTTTNKIKNNKTLSQFPALISKTKISYDQLSNFQRKNLRNNYKSIEKLITHLGYDKNTYISFEMYEIFRI